MIIIHAQNWKSLPYEYYIYRKGPGFRDDMGMGIKVDLFAKNQHTNNPDIHLNTLG